MPDALWTGILAGYAIAIPVGPIATLAGLVGAALAGAIAPVVGPARLLGAALLVAIAVRGIIEAARSSSGPRTVAGSDLPASGRRDPLRTYLLFLGLTIVNPVTFLYFGALMLGLPAAAAGSDRLLFVLGAFGSSLSWQLLLATAGAVLHGRVPDRLQAATRAIGSLIVLGFAARLLLSAQT